MDLSALYYIAAFVTAMVGFFLVESYRKKNEADTAKSLTTSAMSIVESKDRDLTTYSREKITLSLYSAYLMTGIRLLQTQLKASGLSPDFEPKSLDEFRTE